MGMGHRVSLNTEDLAIALQINAASLPFCMSGFKYLGGHITLTFSGLYANAILPLIIKITSDLQRWDALHTSSRQSKLYKNERLRLILILISVPPSLSPKNIFIH